jgi:hypothetical protein
MENPEKCPICGGTSFARGSFQFVAASVPQVGVTPILVLPTSEKRPKWKQLLSGTGRKLGPDDVQARLCESCNNLQLFIKPKQDQ